MRSEAFFDELEEVVSSPTPLSPVVSTLRRFRDAGISRDEVRRALESLREHARDEATEDRILEVMDIVSGFCSGRNAVWDDSPPGHSAP